MPALTAKARIPLPLITGLNVGDSRAGPRDAGERATIGFGNMMARHDSLSRQLNLNPNAESPSSSDVVHIKQPHEHEQVLT
jgi:hypothetical protein